MLKEEDRVQVIFEKEDFNKKNIYIKNIAKNCDNNEFKELQYLKDIHSSLIMEGCKLSADIQEGIEKVDGERVKKGEDLITTLLKDGKVLV